MRRNRYGGVCAVCNRTVAPYTGILDGRPGAWRVRHLDCAADVAREALIAKRSASRTPAQTIRHHKKGLILAAVLAGLIALIALRSGDHQSAAVLHPYKAVALPGPSARCVDGTLSYSEHRSGTCSWHHGVGEWLSGEAQWDCLEPPGVHDYRLDRSTHMCIPKKTHERT